MKEKHQVLWEHCVFKQLRKTQCNLSKEKIRSQLEEPGARECWQKMWPKYKKERGLKRFHSELKDLGQNGQYTELFD